MVMEYFKSFAQLGKLTGYVVRAGSMKKTVLVHIPFWWRHPKYERIIKKRTKLFAHDEFDLCRVGDMVRLKTCRPLSKNKSHLVETIMRREDGSALP